MKKNSGANLPKKDFPYFSYNFFNYTCSFVLNKYVLMIIIILEIHRNPSSLFESLYLWQKYSY